MTLLFNLSNHFSMSLQFIDAMRCNINRFQSSYYGISYHIAKVGWFTEHKYKKKMFQTNCIFGFISLLQ
jgi:hypothetical protein